MKEKIEALSKFLEVDFDEAEGYIENGDYIVLTDDEADEKAKEYIEETVWAFNADFLSDMTGLPSEMFTGLQEKCEGANDAFLKVIGQSCGLDEFIDTAISLDGRGHFISSYDGEENIEGEFFIYRIN